MKGAFFMKKSFLDRAAAFVVAFVLMVGGVSALPEGWLLRVSAADDIGISETTFPDAVFRSYVLNNIDQDSDGKLSQAEIAKTESIYVSSNQISDLQGIEFFTNLLNLDVADNQLTSLDLSHNTELWYLRCNNNQLTSLDLNCNTALGCCDCHSNQLTSLDLSNNTALDTLECGGNPLTSLDVSKCTNLRILDFFVYEDQSYEIPLESLDIRNCTALERLWCSRCQLTSLNVSNNTALHTLNCYNNRLTSLDLSHNMALEYLACYNNQLTSLDVSQNPALEKLFCDDNQLTSLDVSKNTALTLLWCNDCSLTSLDMSHNTALENLDCSNNMLTSLDLSKNTALKTLNCNGNHLVSIDLSNNSALEVVNVFGNRSISLINGRYSLNKLGDGFDVSKCSNWRGAEYDPETNSLINFTNNEVEYEYDCGSIRPAYFTLQLEQTPYTPASPSLPTELWGGWYDWRSSQNAGYEFNWNEKLSDAAAVKVEISTDRDTKANCTFWSNSGFGWNYEKEYIQANTRTVVESSLGIGISPSNTYLSSSVGFDNDCTWTVHSVSYYDKDGELLLSENIGKTGTSGVTYTEANFDGWDTEMTQRVKKAVVGLSTTSQTNVNTSVWGRVIINGSSQATFGTIGNTENTSGAAEPDFALSKGAVTDVKIPITLTDGISINISEGGERYSSNPDVSIRYIKLLDEDGNVVTQIPVVSEPSEPNEPSKPTEPSESGDKGEITVAPAEIGEGTPETEIETPAASVKDAITLTEEEEEAIEKGEDLKITLSVEKADNIPDEDKAKIEAEVPEDFKIGLSLDINLSKQVGNFIKNIVKLLKHKIDIAVELPPELINTDDSMTREYAIIHLHDGKIEIIRDCIFDPVTKRLRFPVDKFSVYAIAYKDTPKASDEVTETVYSVIADSSAVVFGNKTAGSTMTVSVPWGMTAKVYSGNELIVSLENGGSFTMPANNVIIKVVDESGAGMMAHAAPNSYIYAYSSDMELIKTSRSKKGIRGTGEMTVTLGASYAGRTVTLYSGKKSTIEKLDETVLDAKGSATFTVKGAKNYTLVVEDE